jgi:hypothetical protein
LAPDYRHAIVFEDVNEAVIDSLDAPFAAGAEGMIRCADSRNIFIRNCRPPESTGLFLDLSGLKTDNILLMSNDFSGIAQVSRSAVDVPESALILQADNLSKK